MTSTAIPQKTNLILSTAIVVAFALSLIVMPVLMNGHAAGMVLITFALVPLNTPLWSLIHEAIHKNFHPGKKANEIAGRLMSIVFGAAFGVLRFGHLMHHQYNRDWESEYYVASNRAVKIKVWVHHYFQMLGGLYLTEIILSYLIAVLPRNITQKVARKIFADERHYQAVLNSVLKPDNVRKIRIDCAAITGLYAGVFMVFGAYWWIAALSLCGRAVTISIMDNAYHYGTPQDGSVVAKELKTPSLLSRFILNFNFHMTHHKNVSLPWTELAAHHDIQGNEYAEGLGSALIGQFKGPIKIED